MFTPFSVKEVLGHFRNHQDAGTDSTKALSTAVVMTLSIVHITEEYKSQRQLTFNGLHGIISQQIVLFITTV
jgi:hypothetical protein